MQDPGIWNMVTKHLADKETATEKENFYDWLNQNNNNKELFNKLKMVWDGKVIIHDTLQEPETLTFSGRFTKEKMKDMLLNQFLGNFIGFIVGMWVTSSFSHQALEERGLSNLFGLAGRKEVVVNEIPEWQQTGIAILLGFIALELINHFFQTKKHLKLIEFLKKQLAAKIK